MQSGQCAHDWGISHVIPSHDPPARLVVVLTADSPSRAKASTVWHQRASPLRYHDGACISTVPALLRPQLRVHLNTAGFPRQTSLVAGNLCSAGLFAPRQHRGNVACVVTPPEQTVWSCLSKKKQTRLSLQCGGLKKKQKQKNPPQEQKEPESYHTIRKMLAVPAPGSPQLLLNLGGSGPFWGPPDPCPARGHSLWARLPPSQPKGLRLLRVRHLIFIYLFP